VGDEVSHCKFRPASASNRLLRRGELKDNASIRIRRLGGGDVQIRKRDFLGIIRRVNPKTLADDCVVAGFDAMSVVENEHSSGSGFFRFDRNWWRSGCRGSGRSFLGGCWRRALGSGRSRHLCGLIGLQLFEDGIHLRHLIFQLVQFRAKLLDLSDKIGIGCLLDSGRVGRLRRSCRWNFGRFLGTQDGDAPYSRHKYENRKKPIKTRHEFHPFALVRQPTQFALLLDSIHTQF
jgi:hypothetical protein